MRTFLIGASWLAMVAAQPALGQALSTSSTSASTASAPAPQTSDPSSSGAARPQTAAPDDAVPDIVVYGQRRAAGESLQRVPIAITAADAATIQATNSFSITDIGSLAPNVRTVGNGVAPGLPAFFIRGVGADVSIRTIDPPVNIIQDGMVIAYTAGAIVPVFDLETVEVLRGPQGVLFGRNSTGGAISLRTRRPSETLGAKLDVAYGNFNELNANASIEGPIAGSTLLGKIAILYRRNTGTTRNTNDGTFVAAPGNPTGARTTHPTGYVGDIDELTIKPTFEFKPSDRTTIILFGQYSRFNDDGGIPRQFSAPPGLAATAVTTLYGFTPPASGSAGFSTNLTDTGYYRLRAGHAILEMTNDIGIGTLTTTAAYRHVSYDSNINFGGSPFAGILGSPVNGNFFYLNTERNDQYSFESRFNGRLTDGLDLTAGLFFLRSDIAVNENRIVQITVAAPTYQRGQFDQRTDALAGYLNLDWGITDTLKVSLGGRYSRDRKRLTYAPIVACPGGNLAACPQNFQTSAKTWTNFSPRAVVSWQPAPTAMIYASYTAGFRSGNYNPRTVNLGVGGAGPVNPETVDTYEAGAKFDLFDRKLRINLDAYRSIYSDIQQIITTPGGVIVQTLVNTAKARIQGLEVEVTARPFPGLTLNANGGLTDAKYTRFNFAINGVTNPLLLRLPKVSKWTAYLAATYTTRVPGLNGDLSLRVSYDYRSGFVSDFLNTSGLASNGFGLTDANLTFAKGNWSLSVFGRNIFNVYNFDLRARSFSWIEFGGRPRTYGVRGTISF